MKLRTPVLALAFLVAATSIASAQAPLVKKDSLVISNPTSMTIYYEIRWENGDWQSFSVDPGSERSHFRGVTSLLPPLVEIRFDYDLSDRIAHRTYNLITTLVADPFNGNPYAFRVSDFGNTLELLPASLINTARP